MGVGDRIFWSFMCFFVIGLLWLRFLEPFIPIWGSLIVSGIVVVGIANYKRK
jgi:predicted small integral membrane protein